MRSVRSHDRTRDEVFARSEQTRVPDHSGDARRVVERILIPVWPKSPNTVRPGSKGAALGRAAEVKKMRETSRLAFCQIGPLTRERIRKGSHDMLVTLWRFSPRLLDTDNWVSACKAVRDGIADACGVADNAPNLRFRYEQAQMPKMQEVWAHVSVVPL